MWALGSAKGCSWRNRFTLAVAVLAMHAGALGANDTAAVDANSTAYPGYPLRGEYGFLTVYDGLTETEARTRIREMVEIFRIREFQFYDAFEGYSRPPTDDKDFWRCACFGRPVNRSLLLAYTDEIQRLGGRSWLYVQAMGTDVGDTDLQRGFTVLGQHMVDGKPLLDVVAPNAAWASKVAPRWASFAASLRFSGIHWDTLGAFNGGSPAVDIPGFLRAAKPLLVQQGLAQNLNFVDGYGWEANLVLRRSDWAENTVVFPYWEVWTLPRQYDRFVNEAAPCGGGVLALYPGKVVKDGLTPIDRMIRLWHTQVCLNNSYVGVGDGLRHIQTEYFPDTAPLSPADVARVATSIFAPCDAAPSCRTWASFSTRTSHQLAAGVAVLPLLTTVLI